MKHKVIILALLLISSTLTVGFLSLPKAKATEVSDKIFIASPRTIWVPDNYTTIQEAIGYASDGDTIFVKVGIYHEHVHVTKSLTLLGENRNTIIDGDGVETVVSVERSNVKISGFTIRNGCVGILLMSWYVFSSVGNNLISNNTIINNNFGVLVSRSGGNVFTNNNMTDNTYSFGVWGGSLSDFIQDMDTSNIIDGKPVYYLVDERDRQISGNVGYVAVVNSKNVTVKNLTLKNNIQGVLFAYTTDSTVENVNVLNNDHGIVLRSSNRNTITGNTVTNNVNGIDIGGSTNNVLRDNNMTDNRYNFGVFGIFYSPLVHTSNTVQVDGYYPLSHFIQDIDTSNIINGKPIYYLVNQSNIIIDPDSLPNIGYLGLVNSINIVVEGLKLENNRQGVLLAYTANLIIENVTIPNNGYGFELIESANNTVMNSNITSTFGIYLEYSNSNTLSNNYIAHGKGAGIYLYYSHSNIISKNNILNNNEGIRLEHSMDNNICHNNFIDNTYQAHFVSLPHPHNTWDNGAEGNYWSDYNGTDTDQDGIGDAPYVIDESNQDNYPLMGMFSDFPISSIGGYKLEKIFYVTTISNSTITSFGLSPIIHIETGKWEGGVVYLNVIGPEGTKGFCRFAIPKDLLDCPEGLEYWAVFLNGTDVTSSCNIWENSTHTFIYVPYNHSIQEIMVLGTWIIPEFPSALILPLLLIIAIIAVFAAKRTLVPRIMKKEGTRHI